MKNKIENLFLKTASGIKPGLDITENLLKNLNNPQKNFYSIHIAGTNGKGSVASYIEKILRCAGFKTGLYTSPHLYDFKERIRVSGKKVDELSLLKLFDKVEKADTGSRKATFFEFTTAMAFEYFSEQRIEVAVVETGMGGRFDSTNLVDPLLSIITNISIEHTEFLGNTIDQIAYEKAGIIKKNRPVIFGDYDLDSCKIIANYAKDQNSNFFCVGKNYDILKKDDSFFCSTLFNSDIELKPSLKGKHQLLNSSMAVFAVLLLNEFYSEIFSIGINSIEKGIQETDWKGRLQTISKNPLVIVDCAHNPHSAKVLYDFIMEKGKKVTMIFGSLSDKDYEKSLKILEPACSKFIFTKPGSKRALSPFELKKLTDVNSEIIESPVKALSYALKKAEKNEIICVAGSIYLSGMIIEAYDNGTLKL